MNKVQQAKWDEPLIMDKGYPGRRAHIPEFFEYNSKLPNEWKRKKNAELPEVSELELIRHVIRLSQMNHGVDVGEYPLGSCTMKYNPKINELIAKLPGFTTIHPDMPESEIQGIIEVIYKLQEALKKITGFSGVTLQPAAGAQGEFVGMLIAKKYFETLGDYDRKNVIVPDSAHGTNPASASMAGFKVIEIPSTDDGYVDIEALKSVLNKNTAVFMITNPSTLGIFEKNILEIEKLVHEVGALMYLDGANFNGIAGIVRPIDMGFDIMHFNLHKTFASPHGGGGPGCGPVGVTNKLINFLPIPIAEYDKEKKKYYFNYNIPNTIGKVHGYYGNFGVMLRSLAYIYRNNGDGIKEFVTSAVLNANYLMDKVSKIRGFAIPKAKNIPRKHEFIASPVPMMRDTGINAGDIAKAMLDYGIHSPTIYFPLIVKEAMMFEPTEAETKTNLDHIIAVLQEISDLAYSNSELLHNMPSNTSIGRLDEYSLAKNPILSKKLEELKE